MTNVKNSLVSGSSSAGSTALRPTDRWVCPGVPMSNSFFIALNVTCKLFTANTLPVERLIYFSEEHTLFSARNIIIAVAKGTASHPQTP